MVNTRRKHVKLFIYKIKLCNENQLEAHNQQYRPISMSVGQLPNWILLPAGWDHPEPSQFNYSRCTSMAIDKLSINDVLIEYILGSPPPENTPHEEPIEPQKPALTCTPDSTKRNARRQVVKVQNAGWKAYGKATELYIKNHNNSEQWNPSVHCGPCMTFIRLSRFTSIRKSG